MQDAWIPDTDDRDVIDEAIGRLAARKGELEIELGRWLLAAERAQVHRALGFGSFAEYVERRVGYDARTTREKLRVARALEALPRLRAELTSGRRPWSVVREVARVITPETEVAWLESTARMTARQVAAAVAGRKRGDGPEDARDPLLMSRRLAFELPPEAYVLVHAALERARAEVAPSASPGEVLRVLAEAYLGGRPTRGAGYQITVTVCASCEGTWQQAGGDRIEVAGEIGACARCDGEIVGVEAAHDGPTAGDGSSAPARVSSARTALDVAPPESAAITAPPESAAITASPEASASAPTVPRSSRSLLRIASRIFGVPLLAVTPRLRAAVRARDRQRCAVPGCRHFRFVDLHHRQPRAAGGPTTLDNLVSLCTAHHRAVHEGVLAIEGSPAEVLRFVHAGGVLYGAPAGAAHVGRATARG